MPEKSPVCHMASTCRLSVSYATKVVIASIILPNIIPISGTSNCCCGGNCRNNIIKIPIPSKAERVAIDIFSNNGAEGNTNVANRIPTAALWLAPIMLGSIKRFFSTIWITIPATPRVAPTNTTATVRGKRLINNTCSCSGW